MVLKDRQHHSHIESNFGGGLGSLILRQKIYFRIYHYCIASLILSLYK